MEQVKHRNQLLRFDKLLYNNINKREMKKNNKEIIKIRKIKIINFRKI